MRTSASIRKPMAKTSPIAGDSCHSLKTPAASHAWCPPDLESSSDQQQANVILDGARIVRAGRCGHSILAAHAFAPKKKGMP